MIVRTSECKIFKEIPQNFLEFSGIKIPCPDPEADPDAEPLDEPELPDPLLPESPEADPLADPEPLPKITKCQSMVL
jgi:hypothetical protein